jgi:hypothetical protein
MTRATFTAGDACPRCGTNGVPATSGVRGSVCIVTDGGQDFVRVYCEAVDGIPPEQVIGTAGGTKYGYANDGKPFPTKEPKLLLNDNNAGKPEGIHLMIGGNMQALDRTRR